MIKKELGVYRRVPGSSDQKTDLFAFGEHPTRRGSLGLLDGIILDLYRLRPVLWMKNSRDVVNGGKE